MAFVNMVVIWTHIFIVSYIHRKRDTYSTPSRSLDETLADDCDQEHHFMHRKITSDDDDDERQGQAEEEEEEQDEDDDKIRPDDSEQEAFI